jgi:hypothetical protein
MQKTIIITADLGHLKAFAVEQDDGPGAPSIRLLQKENTDVAQHLSEIVTDQAGRYRKRPATGAGPTNRSDGEPHHFGIERRKRALKTLAKGIDELLTRERAEAWCFAAASEINRALLDALNKTVRARMQQNVRANLTGASKAEVLGHFDLRPQTTETVDFLAQQRSTARGASQGNAQGKTPAGRNGPLKEAVRGRDNRPQAARERSRLSDTGENRRSSTGRHSPARSRRFRADA